MTNVVPRGNVVAPGLSGLSGLFSAGQGIAGGVTTAIQGAAMFDKDDERRLSRLKGLRRSGQLGLGELERTRLEGRQAVERGGMLRTQQDQSNQAMQALANQNAISGRDVFLAQMAAQEGEAMLRAQQDEAMAIQNMQAKQQQQAEIAQLREQERARKAAIRSGITQAATAGLFAVGGARSEERYR